MKHPSPGGFLARLLSLALCLTLCLAPMAQALTTDQLKNLLDQYYIDGLSDELRSLGSVEEILDALDDPYTIYMNAEQYQALLRSMQDSSVVGIGVEATTHDQGLLILGAYQDSPAQKAGLSAGDIVVEVDGNRCAGETSEVIVGWLRGAEGSTVSLKVLHPDGSTKAYTLTRAMVVIPATQTQVVDGHIGYISCETFGEDTLTHFQEGMSAHPDVDTWIVDLRNNLGGDVYAVTQSLGVFLGQSSIVYLKDGNDQYLLYGSQQSSETLYPAIVLTSGQTASAAEIYSAAIRDHDAGLLIGDRTFGKGVAQVVLSGQTHPEEFAEGDAIRITAYRYYATSGTTADKVGVMPHLLVDPHHADEIALLFAAQAPEGDNSRYLRIHLGGWRWHLNLDACLTETNTPYFVELLEALPKDAPLYQGNGSDWTLSDAATVAKACGLSQYTPRTFSDAETCQWGDALNTLKTYGLLSGYEDGSFRPGQSMTRAELCSLLSQALSLESTRTTSSFTDVSPTDWYFNAIHAVTDEGLVQGLGNGRFDPQGMVTHEQLITILGRLSVNLNAYLDQAAKQTPQAPAAAAGYSHWAAPWVWLLGDSQKNIYGQTINLLYDDPENLSPQAAANRGQAGALLYTILSYTNFIPI